MKKNLLNENTIRRFMKLASIGSVGTDSFVEGMGHAFNRDEEELAPEGELEMGGEEELAPEGEPELELEPEGDEELDAGGDADITDEEAEVLISLGKKLQGALDDEGLDAEPELDDELPPEEEGPADLESPEGGEEDEEFALDEALSGVELVDDTKIINEVMRRVAQRLRGSAKPSKASNR